MSFFTKPKSKKEEMEERRRRRRGDGPSPTARWFNAWQVVAALLFLAMAALVTAICFLGLRPALPQMIIGERARVRIVADFPFSYSSSIQTEREQNRARQETPSFYRYDAAAEQRIRQALVELLPALDQFQQSSAKLSPADQAAARENLARNWSEKFGLMLDPQDVLSLTDNVTSAQRAQAFDEGLMSVHQILSQGVYDSSAAGWTAAAGSGTLFKLEVPGRVGPAMLLAQDEAERDLLKELYINQAPMDLTPAAQAAICRVLKQAIVPNIQFDSDLTSLKRQAAVATVKPVVEDVVKGEVLVDPSAPVTLDQRERLTAYNLELSKRSSTDLTSMTGLTQRFLFVALLLAAAVIFIKSGLGQLEHSPKLFALTGVLLLLNLAVLRIVLSLGDTSLLESRPTVQAVLPWVAPTVLAPMLVAVLIGAAPAVLTALLISILFSMMTGDTLEVFLVNFLAALVTIHLCREVRMRKRLVRAGLVGGLAAAACAAYLGYVNELGTSTNTVFDQMLVAVLTGLLTAVVAIGLLPLFEHLFKITTDITLLELTDFNHPLLRKLQLAAPGSYHHSLMVANLAERAAAEIGANALMCRTCALYHDIGKMVKPEYFTENQRDGFNPHAEVNPSMSALIIKSHVKEGLDLAQQYKLPQVVQDVIAQHHGTTLIKYFYRKASEQQQLLAPAPFPRRGHASRAPFAPADAPAPTPEPAERGESNLDESFYRYDGPKPRFRESVIIALADAVEAASRSLRKVTPLAVEELIESLINDRLEDHQLDDSPITLQELKKIKQSFNFTLLNMLHSRVQYPGEQGVAPAPAAKTAGTPPARATA